MCMFSGFFLAALLAALVLWTAGVCMFLQSRMLPHGSLLNGSVWLVVVEFEPKKYCPGLNSCASSCWACNCTK